MEPMRYGELFAGIGGMSLGLERAGMRPAWFSEINPYASRVLAKHWPDVPNLGDVTHIDWSQVEPVDLLCGGFPCQPFSVAGKQLGEADERNLWPEVVRAIRGVRPRLILMENVPALLSDGYFGRVLGDLAACGYDTEWDCIPAAAVGAPHRRDRIFVVAHAQRQGSQGHGREHRLGEGREQVETGWGGADAGTADLAYPPRVFRDGSDLHLGRDQERAEPLPESGDGGANPAPGLGWWAVEPDVGRVAYGVPSRVDRLTALGNAVVPQVAEWIGRRIMEVYG